MELDLPLFCIEKRDEHLVIDFIINGILKVLLIVRVKIIFNGLQHLIRHNVHAFLLNIVVFKGLGLAEELPLVVFIVPDVLLLVEDHHEDFEAFEVTVLAEGILEHLFLVEGEVGA